MRRIWQVARARIQQQNWAILIKRNAPMLKRCAKTTLAILPPFAVHGCDFHTCIRHPTRNYKGELKIDVYVYPHGRFEHWNVQGNDDEKSQSMDVEYCAKENMQQEISKYDVKNITLNRTKCFIFVDGKYSATSVRSKNEMWSDAIYVEDDDKFFQQGVMEFIQKKRAEFRNLVTNINSDKDKKIYYKAAKTITDKTITDKKVIVSMIAPKDARRSTFGRS